MFKTNKKYILKLFFFLVFVLLTNIIFARDITITIIDIDLNLPLEGAVIRTREGIEYICDHNGKALINIPENRQIIIQAAYPGYENGVITIPVTGDSFTIALHLSGFMQGNELVLEASIPGTTESRTGRSIAVTSKEISQSGEMGIIEDVMGAIKLLPGVNYSGTFDAEPSIRGGHPGDMMASFDGFYINNPYHWGGGFSIFDPRMVHGAQLSHGVFSTRYGNTISGLLEVTSKTPSPTETTLEFGVNFSMAVFNLSIPILGKGGILFMGRVTFYDPYIALVQALSKYYEPLTAVNYIERTPYIRSGAITGNYRFTDKIELNATAFFGMDGMGAHFLNSNRTESLNSDTSAEFDYTNYQAFLTSSLLINPRKDMLLKVRLGTGYEKMIIDGEIFNDIIEKHFSDNFFTERYPFLNDKVNNPYNLYNYNRIYYNELLFTVQGRVDFDWEIKDWVLLSAGIQEMYNQFNAKSDTQMTRDISFNDFKNELDKMNLNEQLFKSIYGYIYNIPFNSIFWDDLIISKSFSHSSKSKNHLLTTSAYVLSEFHFLKNKINMELGLRLEYFHIFGDANEYRESFSLGSNVILSPRLNLDFNILRNKSFLQSFDITLGTGLFSSMNNSIFSLEEKYDMDKIKPNRSWTSVLGIKMEFSQSLMFTIEGYYKYVFDRMYDSGLEQIENVPKSDGKGIVWGIDLMIQKVQSRYWDGWLSYSFNWAKYKDPSKVQNSDWYFPSYHRYHNLNLVINIRPIQSINIYIRFGLATGVVLSRRSEEGPKSYPVLVNPDDPQNSYIIEKYKWDSVVDEKNRTTSSLPMDIKFSILGASKTGKTRYEIYVAVENVLALVYSAKGNTSFNSYTGQIDEGNNTARYDIPIPIPTFGFKLSY